mgnify:CR=1 FL=1
MMCRDARIQRRARRALGARGGRFGHSLSSCGIRTSLCITGTPRAARGCDRRIDAGRRQQDVSALFGITEAAA